MKLQKLVVSLHRHAVGLRRKEPCHIQSDEDCTIGAQDRDSLISFDDIEFSQIFIGSRRFGDPAFRKMIGTYRTPFCGKLALVFQ